MSALSFYKHHETNFLPQKFITNAYDFVSKTSVSCLFWSHQQFQPFTQGIWIAWEKAFTLFFFLLTFHFLLWCFHIFLPNWSNKSFPFMTPVCSWSLWIFWTSHSIWTYQNFFIFFHVFTIIRTRFWLFHCHKLPKTFCSPISFAIDYHIISISFKFCITEPQIFFVVSFWPKIFIPLYFVCRFAKYLLAISPTFIGPS